VFGFFSFFHTGNIDLPRNPCGLVTWE